MDNKSIAVKLIENTPLAVMVIGLFLIVIGAAGGLPQYGLQVPATGWRIVLVFMGATTAGTGVLLYWHKSNLGKARELNADLYGIKIMFPENKDRVPNRIALKGIYQVKPTADYIVRVFEYSMATRKCYPRSELTFDEKSKKWETSLFNLRGNPGDIRVIMIVIMGNGGRALCEHYDVVEEQLRREIGLLTLTPDIVECDRIKVERK